MEHKLKNISLLVLIVLNLSCNTYRNIPYFQNLDHSKYSQEEINNYSPLKIQPGDILEINVNSINQEAASVFNPSLNRANGNNPKNIEINPIYGYKVGPNGDVQLPLVGNMKVVGMTIDQVNAQLTANLLPYLKSPIVNTHIINFRISVLGDVLRPDVYTVQNEHININEALSLAGDLNITAKRKNVLLVRELNGKREYFNIDLTKKDLFNSPYYYLQNNDILYIEPDRTKYASVDPGYRAATLILSGLSVAAIIISALLVQHH